MTMVSFAALLHSPTLPPPLSLSLSLFLSLSLSLSLSLHPFLHPVAVVRLVQNPVMFSSKTQLISFQVGYRTCDIHMELCLERKSWKHQLYKLVMWVMVGDPLLIFNFQWLLQTYLLVFSLQTHFPPSKYAVSELHSILYM